MAEKGASDPQGAAGVTTAARWTPLVTAQTARDDDAWTIESVGIPGIVLMEHAGKALADRAQALAGAGPVAVVCGPGNNGGDGWVAARLLATRGVSTAVFATRAPEALKGDAQIAARACVAAFDALGLRASVGDGAYIAIDDETPLSPLLEALSPTLVVDALFGTGLSRALSGPMAAHVDAINACPAPCLAVDLPSGAFTDGQAPAGPCVNAVETLTFHDAKIAHACAPTAAFCGAVTVVDIGILRPPTGRMATQCVRIDDVDTAALLPVDAGDHKGRFGHVAVLAGAHETAGAAHLAAHAALRSGAGLCTLLTDGAPDGPIAHLPEVMQRAFSDDALDGMSALVVGPGLGRDDDAQARGARALAAAAARGIPVVVDADGLPLLAEADRGLQAVATPHPGEAGRLLHTSSSDVEHDRLGATAALARLAGPTAVTWVLKGAAPIVRHASGVMAIVPGANASLAVAGSGDVLAGVVAALLARGLSPDDAALGGTFLHQAAGARLADGTVRGHLARDIADCIALALEPEPNRGAP